jgi:hypothetical protein
MAEILARTACERLAFYAPRHFLPRDRIVVPRDRMSLAAPENRSNATSWHFSEVASADAVIPELIDRSSAV